MATKVRGYDDPDPVREQVMEISMGEAVKWSFGSGALATGWVVYMQKYRPWFNKSTNMSARGTLLLQLFKSMSLCL